MKLNFSDPEIRYLIDYANLKQGIIKYQDNFLDEEQFNKFERKIYLGFPLVLPKGIKYFIYDNRYTFKLNKERVLNKIFKSNKRNYIGKKNFFLSLEMNFHIM